MTLQIKDTGIGISDELKDKIIEPFFSTKKDKNGVGLGLAVVYGIIQRHNGKIWMDSQSGDFIFHRITFVTICGGINCTLPGVF